MIRNRLITALLALGLSATASLAAPEPENPAHRTPWGLYLTAKEAYDMKQERGDEVLFVDVRDPIEIMFTGYTDMIDVNLPYLLANPARWHQTKPTFAMEPNPAFVDGVAKALNDRGLDASTPVIVMCRSGTGRGTPSANALEWLELEQVYVVIDGFEGSSVKDHPNGPWRLKDGWKNSGLPWSYKLNPEKIYIRPE